MLRTAFLRNSSFTGIDCHPEARKAPRVVGSDVGTEGTVIRRTVSRDSHQWLVASHVLAVGKLGLAVVLVHECNDINADFLWTCSLALAVVGA